MFREESTFIDALQPHFYTPLLIFTQYDSASGIKINNINGFIIYLSKEGFGNASSRKTN